MGDCVGMPQIETKDTEPLKNSAERQYDFKTGHNLLAGGLSMIWSSFVILCEYPLVLYVFCDFQSTGRTSPGE